MVTSLTNCPVAEVPAPPAVKVITPAEVIVPAKSPLTPPDDTKVEPYAGISATTPALTSTPVPIGFTASPEVQLSLKLNADPAVFISYVPASSVAAAVTLAGAVILPK